MFEVEPRVLIDNGASRTHTVLEINGRDRPGLLYELAKTLKDLGMVISAPIAPWRARGRRVLRQGPVRPEDHPAAKIQMQRGLSAAARGRGRRRAPTADREDASAPWAHRLGDRAGPRSGRAAARHGPGPLGRHGRVDALISRGLGFVLA